MCIPTNAIYQKNIKDAQNEILGKNQNENKNVLNTPKPQPSNSFQFKMPIKNKLNMKSDAILLSLNKTQMLNPDPTHYYHDPQVEKQPASSWMFQSQQFQRLGAEVS